ncbi:MAG: hypothetical protein FWE31_01405 [Firmicutes bacterium]|nr:hypothetical protein [Bacillota bacterium]
MGNNKGNGNRLSQFKPEGYIDLRENGIADNGPKENGSKFVETFLNRPLEDLGKVISIDEFLADDPVIPVTHIGVMNFNTNQEIHRRLAIMQIGKPPEHYESFKEWIHKVLVLFNSQAVEMNMDEYRSYYSSGWGFYSGTRNDWYGKADIESLSRRPAKGLLNKEERYASGKLRKSHNKKNTDTIHFSELLPLAQRYSKETPFAVRQSEPKEKKEAVEYTPSNADAIVDRLFN